MMSHERHWRHLGENERDTPRKCDLQEDRLLLPVAAALLETFVPLFPLRFKSESQQKPEACFCASRQKLDVKPRESFCGTVTLTLCGGLGVYC